jgi:hypothetical protein
VFEPRAVLHRPEGLVEVEAVDAFGGGVGDDRGRVVADHRVGLVGGEFPDGQAPPVLVVREEGVDEVARAAAVDDGVERVRGAEGVPQREDRVVLEALGAVRLLVEAAELPVHVHEQVGRDHRVIERRVEVLELRQSAAARLDLL